jgi:hypothetical protein
MQVRSKPVDLDPLLNSIQAEPMTRAEIANRSGLTYNQLRKQLPKLVQSGACNSSCASIGFKALLAISLASRARAAFQAKLKHRPHFDAGFDLFAETSCDRSDRGSSPYPMPPQSPGQIVAASRHSHRLLPRRGAASWNRRSDRHGCPST